MTSEQTEKRKKPPAGARIVAILMFIIVAAVAITQVGWPDSLTPGFLK